MAIARPTKALGNDQYTEEVAAGKLDIIDQEIDDDFNVVYNAVNLIDSGVFTGRIPYSSLDLTGKIQDSDLTTINAARLYGNLPHTIGGVFVDGSSIIAGTLPPRDTATHQKTTQETQSGSTPIVSYLQVAFDIAASAQVVSLHAAVMGSIAQAPPGTSIAGIGIRLDNTVIHQVTVSASGGQTGITTNFPYSLVWPFLLTGLAAGSHTVTVDVYQPGPNFTNNFVSAGSLVATVSP